MAKMADGEDIKRPHRYDEGAVAVGLGRGRFLGDSTAVKGVSTVGHPVLSSPHMHYDIIIPGQYVPNPATSSSGIGRGASAVHPIHHRPLTCILMHFLPCNTSLMKALLL